LLKQKVAQKVAIILGATSSFQKIIMSL